MGHSKTTYTHENIKFLRRLSFPVPKSGALRGFAFKIGKTGDLNVALRESSNKVKMSPHCLNVTAQRGQVHISPALHFGDRRLLNIQDFSQDLL